jgi:hypothetical protein
VENQSDTKKRRRLTAFLLSFCSKKQKNRKKLEIFFKKLVKMGKICI